MKTIGGLLIILTSIIISHTYDKRQKERICALKEISEFISFVKLHIEYFALPLCDIYKKYNSKSRYADNLINGYSIDILDKETMDELSKAMTNLGKGYKEEQLKLLDYLNLVLTKKITENEENYAQKTRVFRAISLFVGCCIVILLL